MILRHNASFSMHKTHHAELLMRKQSGGLGSTGSASCLQESMRTDEGSFTTPHAAHDSETCVPRPRNTEKGVIYHGYSGQPMYFVFI